MTILPRWLQRFTILQSDNPKGPWGGGGPDKSGSGSGSGGGNEDGPRNPWSVPPAGRPRSAGPSALDEFLRRARGGGGGSNGGGRPRIPGTPSPRSLWIIGGGLIVLVWLGFTSFHVIGPQQRGVVTYLGRYAGTLDPGISFTPPAPIANVTKVDVRKINTETFPVEGGSAENLMLTGDQNIIDLDYSVRWDINHPQNYAFQIAKPVETVRATAESAMRAVIATTTLDDAIGSGRTGIEIRVQDMMQEVLDSYKSGVRIQGVAIKQAGPPAQVMDDFKLVSAAQQEAQGMTNQARGYAQQVLAHAQGEAAAFDKVYEQYRLAPEVTRRRMYYETMETVLARTDKTIVQAPGVVPYLPLPSGAQRLPDAQTPTPAPVQGAGR